MVTGDYLKGGSGVQAAPIKFAEMLWIQDGIAIWCYKACELPPAVGPP